MKEGITLKLDPQSYNDMMRKLANLEDYEKEATLKKGFQDASMIIQRETINNITSRLKQHTGNLVGSVTHTIKVDKVIQRAWIGFKRPEGNVAHILEQGTVERKYNGANRGKVRAYHFQQDSVDKKGDEALNTLAESINASIQKIMNRN